MWPFGGHVKGRVFLVMATYKVGRLGQGVRLKLFIFYIPLLFKQGRHEPPSRKVVWGLVR